MRTAHVAAVVIDLAGRPVGAVTLPSKAINDAGAAPVAVTVTIFGWRLRRLRVILPVDAAMAGVLRRWGRRRSAALVLSMLLGVAAVTGLLSLAVGLSRSVESLVGAVNVVIMLAFVAVIWSCLTTQPALWPQVTATGQVLIRGVDPDVAREWQAVNPVGVIHLLPTHP